MKTVQTVVFYRGEIPQEGCTVTIDRKNGIGGRETVQRFALLAFEDTFNVRDAGLSWKLNWRSMCTECGKGFEVRTNNYTKNLPRRCKPCRKASPYNADGWTTRPRNRYVRADPDEALAVPTLGSPATDEGEASATPLFDALDSASRLVWLRLIKAELGTDTAFADVQAAIEARLIAERNAADEVDPASLF